MKSNNQNFWLLTISLAIFTLVIHLLTNTNYELHRDELLYMALGQHPAFGYMSTPPLMGLLSWLIQHLFDHSEAAIKFLPAFSGALSVVFIALMVNGLGGKNLAVIIAAAAFILSPAFLHSDSLFMPVPFDEFFWLLLAYLVLRLVKTGNEKIWLLIGLASAVAFLNKYSILFFAMALLLALLLSPHRKLLWSKYLAYAFVVALIVASPNLIWQAKHHFPVISHMDELRRTQLVNETPVTFWAGQLLMNLPCVFIWLTGLVGLLFFKRERTFQFIALGYLFAMGFLMLGKGKAYYALGAYPMLFAAGGYSMEKYFTGKLVWLSYGFVLLAAVITGLMLPVALPVLPLEKMEKYCSRASKYIGNWPTRWEDGKNHKIPQDFSDMTGWKELSGLVSSAYLALDTNDQKHCMIFAQNYGQAAAILYYGKPQRLPDPVCVVDAFLFWAPDSTDKTILICVEKNPGKLNELFDNCVETGVVVNPYFRENGLRVYVCHQPKPAWRDYYKNKMRELKDFN